MLTPAWKPLRPHKLQSEAWRCPDRFVTLDCGRGSGKTELARRRVVRFLPVKKPWSRPMYFYALPTYNQAKRVAWKFLRELIPPTWIKKVSESELFIETVFGSELYVVGMDKPQRIEGDQWDGGVIDECCDQKPGSFGRSVLPALSHRNGWCWRIGVPKRYGVGAQEFREACQNPNIRNFHWASSTVLSADQLRWAQENLDTKDFNEQYNANWETAGGSIFHSYDDVLNVEDWEYNPEMPLIIGSDFNVNPMCWIICQEFRGTLYAFDELFIRDTNTPNTLDVLWKRYGGTHRAPWLFYGDASGRARKSAATFTDYAHIHNDDRFKNKRVLYPRSNPSLVNRFAACNALFGNALGERRFKVHTRCKHLRNDLVNRQYKEGTREPDDSGDIGHMTDALGYIIHVRHPLKVAIHQETPEVHVG